MMYQELNLILPIKEQFKNNNAKTPLGAGYGYRFGVIQQFGIVIHTTNGHVGTSFEHEVKFLYSTKEVSAHFIISKSGKITQLLPISYRAYHAGSVNDQQYGNNLSIGIENHYTPTENPNLPRMEEACANLCRYLINKYTVHGIKMHREIAIDEKGNLGRKKDPSHQTDIQFQQWRDKVYQVTFQKTLKTGAILYTSPDKEHPIAKHINDEYWKEGRLTKPFSTHIQYKSNGWAWITNGIGFVETLYL